MRWDRHFDELGRERSKPKNATRMSRIHPNPNPNSIFQGEVLDSGLWTRY